MGSYHEGDGEEASIFYHFVERTTKRTFTTIFKDKYLGIYENAYDAAIDKFMLSDNSSLVWKLNGGEKQIDHHFDRILKKELEASKRIVHKEIKEMIEEEFQFVIGKKWLTFKDDIPKKMLICNNRRKKWAHKKLKLIQNTFKDIWLSEDMKEFMKDNQLQIEEIYE